MVIQISVAIATLTFVILVIFLVRVLLSVKKTVDLLQVDLHRASAEAKLLIDEVSALTKDIKYKSESLNFIFNSLNSFQQDHQLTNKSVLQNQVLPELIGWISQSFILASKTKEFIKKYV